MKLKLLSLFGGLALCSLILAQAEVKWSGKIHTVMMEHDYRATLDLKTLQNTPHLYALGPSEGLNSEITVIDSVPYIASIKGSEPSIEKSWPKAAFLVYTNVSKWKELPLSENPTDLASLAAIVKQFARENGVDVSKPFPFRILGKAKALSYHVVKAGEHTSFDRKNLEVDILGFYSEQHAGVFTHKGEYAHIHFRAIKTSDSGHLEALTLDGKAKLFVPAPTK